MLANRRKSKSLLNINKRDLEHEARRAKSAPEVLITVIDKNDTIEEENKKNDIVANTPANEEPRTMGFIQKYKSALICGFIWLLTSVISLLINFYIIGKQKGSSEILATFNIAISTIISLAYYAYNIKTKLVERRKFSKKTALLLCIIGFTRFLSIMLGLLGLEKLNISMVEIIKSTSIIFSVGFSFFILDQRNSLLVCLSFIPILIGNAFMWMQIVKENSHTFYALAALYCSVITDSFQDSITKYLMLNKKYNFRSIEVICFTSIIATGFTSIFVGITYGIENSLYFEKHLIIYYIISGINYYFLVYSTFKLIENVSPITYSLLNNTKRIFLLILAFLVMNKTIELNTIYSILLISAGIILYVIISNFAFIKNYCNINTNGDVLAVASRLV